MAFVVAGEGDALFETAAERRANLARQMQFRFQPLRHRRHKRAQPARRDGEIGLEQAVEFQQRLFVKDDVVELRRGEPGGAQAVVGGVLRKCGVVLDPRETLLLRGGDNLPADEERGGAVVVESGNPEDAGGGFFDGTHGAGGGGQPA